MTSLLGTLWDFIGSHGMQGCEAMRPPKGSRGTVLPPVSWVQSRLWGSLGRIYGLGLIAG
jgi:hypothetical protein